MPTYFRTSPKESSAAPSVITLSRTSQSGPHTATGLHDLHPKWGKS